MFCLIKEKDEFLVRSCSCNDFFVFLACIDVVAVFYYGKIIYGLLVC